MTIIQDRRDRTGTCENVEAYTGRIGIVRILPKLTHGRRTVRNLLTPEVIDRPGRHLERKHLNCRRHERFLTAERPSAKACSSSAFFNTRRTRRPSWGGTAFPI